MKSVVTWFEIPVSDIKESKAFYEHVFQFEMSDMRVKDEKLAVFPATEVSGALLEAPGYTGPDRAVVLYLNIPDTIAEVLTRAEEKGGKTVTVRTVIEENIGWVATFADLDGNIIGLYESAQR